MLSRGNCWLSVEGIPEPIPLTGGDCFLLARGTSIVFADSPRNTSEVDFREIGAKANKQCRSLMEVVARRRQSSVGP